MNNYWTTTILLTRLADNACINPSGAATRECSWDGTWKSNPNYNSTSGWTNYSACVPPKPIVNPPDFTVC